MKRAVIYARYSSSHQREESIEGQLRECKAFAKSNGLDVVGEYADRAITGKTDERPEFKKMIRDSALREFDFVIVYTLDRFSRDRFNSAIYKKLLKDNGVKLLSAKENIVDGPSGILLESLLEGMAEYYSVELAQKITRGMTENALQCKWASGVVPYGYKVNHEKHLVIDEDKAPIVRKIFNDFVAGRVMAEVARELNEMHAPTLTSGGSWGRMSFSRMISAEIYIGTFKWNNIKKEDSVPAIIDKDTFYKAQKRVQEGKEKRAKHKSNIKSNIYLLSSKLKCGCCGGNLVGMSGTSSNGVLRNYYSCYSRRHKHAECDNGSIPQKVLEDKILEKLVQFLLDHQQLEGLVNTIYQHITDDSEPEGFDNITVLRKQKAEIEKRIDRATTAVLDGFASKALQKKLHEAEAELDVITVKLIEAEERYKELKASNISRQQIAFMILTLPESNLTEVRKMLIECMVSSATAYKDKSGHVTVEVECYGGKDKTITEAIEFAV